MNKSSRTAALLAGALALAAPGMAKTDVVAQFSVAAAIDGSSKDTARTLVAEPGRMLARANRGCPSPSAKRASSLS